MLKHIIYLLLITGLPLLSLGEDQVSPLFEKGNSEYAKGNYKEAAGSYQKIIDAGYESATVYFNAGNAHYKLGDIPSAILYYEKAHKIVPGDADISFNLRLAGLKITDKIEEAPEFFITKWWHSFILFFSVHTLSVLSILFFTVGFLSLIGYLFAQSLSLKKASFYTGIALIFLGLTFIFIANRQAYYFNAHRQAVIFDNSVVVKSGPGAASKDLFVIHEGTKVGIRENQNGWIKIELANGNIGWISAGAAKEI